MQEVAINIENRPTMADVSRMLIEKISRDEVILMLEAKVSHEQLKNYLDQTRYTPKQDDVSEEVRMLKRRLDDAIFDMK
jgi:hypothetical protein